MGVYMYRLIVYNIRLGFPLRIYQFVDGKCVFDLYGRGDEERKGSKIRVFKAEGPEVKL